MAAKKKRARSKWMDGFVIPPRRTFEEILDGERREQIIKTMRKK